MERIKLPLAPGLEVQFADREQALKKVEEWADRGMSVVQVVHGPEGCGKTAWLRQSAVLLRELGFHVIYVDPLRKYFEAYTDVKEVVRRLAEAAAETLGEAKIKLASLVIDAAVELIKRRRRKVAILVDDVFQAIGLGEAASYVKAVLGIIEYPPASYERVIAVVATSEGFTRREIGRHRWAALLTMWNMPRDGFRQLYDQMPGGKPLFEDVWRITGGNPKLLGRLYEARWSADEIVDELIKARGLVGFVESLGGGDRELLAKALDEPDALVSREGKPLLDKLVALNLVVDDVYPRSRGLWVDEPPPERDPELGIGKYVAWQTPLHREAVRRALESA